MWNAVSVTQTGRLLITQTEFLICFIKIRVLSDEIKFTVNFDVLCQIFACKIYSFSNGCPSVESRDQTAWSFVKPTRWEGTTNFGPTRLTLPDREDIKVYA